MTKPILCLDFDGVIHSYTSPWISATHIPDPPVPGAMAFLMAAIEHFQVCIYSSRSGQEGGIKAMTDYIDHHLSQEYGWDKGADAVSLANAVRNQLVFSQEKPPAFLTIDDRALTFDGRWPEPESLLAFKPWNKKSKLGATGEFPDGKIDPTDEGELRFAITGQGDNIRVDFGKPVAWFAMPRETAINLGLTLLKHAGVKVEESGQ